MHNFAVFDVDKPQCNEHVLLDVTRGTYREAQTPVRGETVPYLYRQTGPDERRDTTQHTLTLCQSRCQ